MPNLNDDVLGAAGVDDPVAELPNDAEDQTVDVGSLPPDTPVLDVSGNIIIIDGVGEGIRWRVSGVQSQGTYVNGDPWVVPSGDYITVHRIEPDLFSSPDRKAHGSMVNPKVFEPSPEGNFLGSAQGYDSSMYAQYGKVGDYRDDLNIDTQLPYALYPESSLVSTQSVGTPNSRPQIRRAAVLTCVASAPAAGSFRPPYVDVDGGVKTTYSSTGIDWAALRILTSVGTQSTFAQVADLFARLRLNHIPTNFQRYQHPEKNMPDYARDMCAETSIAAVMLLLDVDQSEKEQLLYNFVQFGIDTYWAAKAVELLVTAGGATNAEARARSTRQLFPARGGHGNGYKWPVLFAGMVLGVQDMIDITQPTSAVAWSEDDQTFYIAQSDVDLGYGYTVPMIGTAEWGERQFDDPTRSIPDWVAPSQDGLSGLAKQQAQSCIYRRCCTGLHWYGQALAASAMPNARTNWANEAFFDYVVRYRSTEPTYSTGPSFLSGSWNNSAWAFSMFDQYAATYDLT